MRRGISQQLGRIANWALDREQVLRYRNWSESKDFGIIRVEYGTDWTSAGKESLEINIDPNDSCDFTAVVGRITSFYESPSLKTLAGVLSIIEPAQLRSLPPSIQKLLPIDQQRDVTRQVEILFNLRESEFQSLLNTGASGSVTIDRTAAAFALGNQFTPEGWKQLVAKYPRVALNVWSDRGWIPTDRRPKGLESRRAADILIGKLLKTPMLLRDSPSVWGRLVKIAPDRERELRSAFLRCAQLGPPSSSSFMPFTTLRLDLPSESALAPFMLTAALSGGELHVESPTLQEVRDRIEECFGSVSRQVAKSFGPLPALTRAALQLAAVIVAGDLRSEDADVMIDAYAPGLGSWLFTSFASVARLIAVQESPLSRRIVGRLLSAARDDFQVRAELDLLLWWWREVSVAPATSGGFTAAWLAVKP
jgi:hypothetical protein